MSDAYRFDICESCRSVEAYHLHSGLQTVGLLYAYCLSLHRYTAVEKEKTALLLHAAGEGGACGQSRVLSICLPEETLCCGINKPFIIHRHPI